MGFGSMVGAFAQHFGIRSPQFAIDVSPLCGRSGMQMRKPRVQSLHGIEQRLARWLLMTQDRVDSGSLRITHDFLATCSGPIDLAWKLGSCVCRRRMIHRIHPMAQ